MFEGPAWFPLNEEDAEYEFKFDYAAKPTKFLVFIKTEEGNSMYELYGNGDYIGVMFPDYDDAGNLFWKGMHIMDQDLVQKIGSLIESKDM